MGRLELREAVEEVVEVEVWESESLPLQSKQRKRVISYSTPRETDMPKPFPIARSCHRESKAIGPCIDNEY